MSTRSSLHASRAPSRRRIWFTAIAVVGAMWAVAAGSVLVVLYMYVWPWVAPPPEPASAIEEKWARVEGIADLDSGACQGDPSLLLEAERSASLCGREIHEKVTPDDDGLVHALPTIPHCAEEAARSLVAWSESDGGFGTAGCSSEHDALGLVRLARLTLATARPRADSPELTAVLELGHRSRTCGTFLHRRVGFAIAADVLAWSRHHDIAPAAPLTRYRPRAAQVLPAVAGEAVCGYELWEETLFDGESELVLPVSLRMGILVDRELLVYRSFHANRILTASEDPSDLGHMAEVMAWDHRDRDVAHSVLLANGCFSMSNQILDMQSIIDDWDAYLAADPE